MSLRNRSNSFRFLTALAPAIRDKPGHQEYAGEDREAYAEKMDANATQSIGRRKAFVQQFVETNVTGVRLKK